MRPLLILFAFIVAAVSVLVTVGCGNAVGASAPVVQDDSHRRYFDGERWVELTVALDRLHVERAGATEDQRSIEVYLLRKPATSVAALDDVARQMQAAQKDIRRISAYVITKESPQAQPMRLTHQFVLRGSVGQDLESLAIRHGARVVNRPAYDPSLLICEVEQGGLMASVTLADVLRQQSGVTLAMPLIERSHLNHVPPGFR